MPQYAQTGRTVHKRGRGEKMTKSSTGLKECLRCSIQSAGLFPQLIVWDGSGCWHITSEKEIQGDVTRLDEVYFCRSCLEYLNEW